MTLKLRHAAPLVILLAVAGLSSCQKAGQTANAGPSPKPAETRPEPLPTVSPPQPGTPGGLPDDRTPLAEGPITPGSAQEAGQVVQTYFANVSQKAYGEAFALWREGGKASGAADAAEFARRFDRYAQYDAQIGAPGAMEGAAGSVYVSVPVVIYGRLKTGEEVHEAGEVKLRRVNDVDGSTAEQRRWHIEAIETK